METIKKMGMAVIGICMMLLIVILFVRTDSNAQGAAEGQTAGTQNPGIRQQVLYDQDGVMIRAERLEYTDEDIRLILTVKNDTEQDLTVLSNEPIWCCNAINSVMILYGGDLSAEVKAKTTETEEMVFPRKELDMYGIGQISEMDLVFAIDGPGPYIDVEAVIRTDLSQPGDYSGESLENGTIWNAADSIVYKRSGTFYEDDMIRLSSAMLLRAGDEEAVVFELENLSDEMAELSLKKIYVNGLKLQKSSGHGVNQILPHKKTMMYFMGSETMSRECMEAFGVKHIDSIHFDLGSSIMPDDYGAKGIELVFSEKQPELNRSGKELYNEGGLRITAKGFFTGCGRFDDSLQLLLLIENNTGGFLEIQNRETEINGYPVDCFAYSQELEDHEAGLMAIDIAGYDYDDAGINGIEDVRSMTFELELKDRDGNVNSTQLYFYETDQKTW